MTSESGDQKLLGNFRKLIDFVSADPNYNPSQHENRQARTRNALLVGTGFDRGPQDKRGSVQSNR